jgi:two-component system sensor histidine kinase DegS
LEKIVQELLKGKKELSKELENLNNLYNKKIDYLSLLQEQITTLEAEFKELKKREIKDISFEKELNCISEKKEELLDKLNLEKKESEDIFLKIKDIEDRISRVSLAISILNGDIKSFQEELEKIPSLQAHGIKVLLAIEEERKRIAREIHDGPAQMLANVFLRLELLEKLIGENPEKGKEEIASFKEIVKESLKEVRNFIFALRPMILDDLGLIPTLKRYLKNMEEHFNISSEFIIIGDEKRMSSVLEMALFRIIQEALNNVIKHANAKNVKVILEVGEKEISVNIKDDGIGFIPEDYIHFRKYSNNLGLVSMKERAELLGGIFKIKSKLGEGTNVFVKIPLSEE